MVILSPFDQLSFAHAAALLVGLGAVLLFALSAVVVSAGLRRS